jgi:endonuclease/exonuclease/phosphatase family metal-dependent hydrolase
MKLINLNIWGGQKHKELLQFVKEINDEIDVICFQEVFKSNVNIFSSGSKMNIYSDLAKILKDYKIFFAPTFTNYDLKTKTGFDTAFGQATFVKNSVELISEGTVFTYRDFDDTRILSHDDYGEFWDLPRNFHYVVVKEKDKDVLIANFHGFWKPGAKKDTKESLEQSDKINEFLKSFNGPKILCGDFNLGPDTESMKKLEKDLLNLITIYNVRNTRSKFYTRNEKFADYILISSDINVKEFSVIDRHVSDHLPLYLDFE